MSFSDDFMDDDFNVDELVKRFESMVEHNQSYYFDADELNVIMEHYLQNNNLKKVNIAADIAITYHPDSPIIQIIKAKQLLANSQAEKALNILVNSSIIDKEDADYNITAGACYSELGQSKKAIKAYMKAAKAFEFKDCEDIFNSIAIEYENLGEIEYALQFFIKGLNREIDLDSQYFEIRNCYSMLNKMSEALDFFKSETDKDPYCVAAWIALASCYVRMGQLEEAIDKYEYALAIDPHNKKAYIDITTAFNELGRYTDTIETVDEAMRYNVESALLQCLYGEAQAKLGNTALAIGIYKNAIKLDENLPEAYAGIGFTLSDQNNPRSALKFLRHAHTLSPYNTDYLFVIVDEYNKLGEYDNALKYVKEILEINPYDENAYISLMECYVLKEDEERAFEALDKGIAFLGNLPSFLYRKAFLYLVQEKTESALLSLEMALDLDYNGHIEFLNFDAENLTKNQAVMDLIEEYRVKKQKNNTK
ncbi:MAG: tetratricopeptide repeat protein [Candidatus Limimorpha sp.]